MPEHIQLVPSASRLMESMRDVGYDLPTSIADLVDNSVEADATEVRIDFVFNNGDSSFIRIWDNGLGMSANAIDEALRYGSRRDYDGDDLGKFGLGLKTASLSHCRRLIVASKRSYEIYPSILMWDLDHVIQMDEWEVIKLTIEEAGRILTERPINNSGTVVVWDKLDRILKNRVEGGKGFSKKSYLAMCRHIEEHLGMVFHRFLDGKSQRKLPLSIYFNGNKINSWDPFVTNEPHTLKLEKHLVPFHQNGREFSISVQPYILPHESMFSSKSAHASAAGPKKWNRQQGFYIYRNDRLIQSGGWNRLRAADEHTKLARIALDFGSDTDEFFQIDIAKMRVQIPSVIREELTDISSRVTSAANSRYRDEGARKKTIVKPTTRGSTAPNITPERKSEPKQPTPIATSISNDVFNQPIVDTPNLGATTSIVKTVSTVTQESKQNSFTTTQKQETKYISMESQNIRDNETTRHSEVDNLIKSVVAVLRQELSDNAELLDRILLKLSDHNTKFSGRKGGV